MAFTFNFSSIFGVKVKSLCAYLSEKINGDGDFRAREVKDEARDEDLASLMYSLCGKRICGGVLDLMEVRSLLIIRVFVFRVSPLHIEARVLNIWLADFPSRIA